MARHQGLNQVSPADNIELASFATLQANQAKKRRRSRRRTFKYKHETTRLKDESIMTKGRRRVRVRRRFKTSFLLIVISRFVFVWLVLQQLVEFQQQSEAANSITSNQFRSIIDADNTLGAKATARANFQVYPSVSLGKFGLIRGLSFTRLSENQLDKSNNETLIKTSSSSSSSWSRQANSTTTRQQAHSSHSKQHRHLSEHLGAVAVFLGVPYAAPPTGLLRFMPPGAARPSQKLAAPSEQCKLQLVANSSQLREETAAAVRVYASFGHECIRLSDWRQASGLQDVATNYSKHLESRRHLQSEDCLNLNIFVPYESASSSSSSSSSSFAHLGDRLASEQKHDKQQQDKQQQRAKRRFKMPNSGKSEIDDHDNDNDQLFKLASASGSDQEGSAQVDLLAAAAAPINKFATTSSSSSSSSSTSFSRRSEESNLQISSNNSVGSQRQDYRDNNQASTSCYLEPLVPPTTAKQHHLNHNQAKKLPVLVLFHSAPPPPPPPPQLSSDDSSDWSVADTKRKKQEALLASAAAAEGSDKLGTDRQFPDDYRRHHHSIPANENKANSLAYVKVARATQSIVITFNYRIGLLGYMPYIDDLEDYLSSSSPAQSPSSSPFSSSSDTSGSSSSSSSASASNSGAQARYNHAIWDQLGLLHWLKHNVASFNGDPGNITLASTDNKSAKLLQLLSMCPIAKGLFRRLILVHDQRQQNKEEDDEGGGGGEGGGEGGDLGQLAASIPRVGSTNNADNAHDKLIWRVQRDKLVAGSKQFANYNQDYLERLLKLALRSRELKRKLINQLGVLVRQILLAKNSSSSNSTESSSGGAGSNSYETDHRNMFEFLRAANLSELALIEFELNRLSVILDERVGVNVNRFNENDNDNRLKLGDLIGEPSLEDKLLFPYFAQLIKLNYLSLKHLDNNQRSAASSSVNSSQRQANGSGRGSGSVMQTAFSKFKTTDKKYDNNDEDDGDDDDGADGFNNFNKDDNLFWLSLPGLFNESLSSSSSWSSSSSSRNNARSLNRIELNYCLYIGQLYAGTHADKIAQLKHDSNETLVLTLDHLNDIDPLKLIPRIDDRSNNSRQLPKANKMNTNSNSNTGSSSGGGKSKLFAWSSPWSWFRGSSSDTIAIAKTNRSNELQAASNGQQHNPWSSATTLVSNWTQSRLVSAIDFYHLRNVHLLNELYLHKSLAAAAAAKVSTSNQFVDNHDEIAHELSSTEFESLLRKQTRSIAFMQQQQLLVAQTGSAKSGPVSRIKRETQLSKLNALGDQLMNQISSYDLLLGFIGRPYGPVTSDNNEHATGYEHANQRKGTATAAGLIIETLANLTKNNTGTGSELAIDGQLLNWLHVADLHFVSVNRARRQLMRAEIKSGSDQNDDDDDDDDGQDDSSCDFISDKIQALKRGRLEPEELGSSSSNSHSYAGGNNNFRHKSSLSARQKHIAAAAAAENFRSSFVFVVNQLSDATSFKTSRLTGGNTNWLLESAATSSDLNDGDDDDDDDDKSDNNLLEFVTNFVWLGVPTTTTTAKQQTRSAVGRNNNNNGDDNENDDNDDAHDNLQDNRAAHSWRPYDTLNRHIEIIDQKEDLIDEQNELNQELNWLVSVHFELISYVKRLLKLASPSATLLRSSSSGSDKHLLAPSNDLTNCVANKLDSESSSSSSSSLSSSNCLAREINKLRQQLRSGASKELEPLIVQYNSMIAKSSLVVLPSNSSFNQIEQNAGTKRAYNMTTRNLVNQSDTIRSQSGGGLDIIAGADQFPADSSSSVQTYSLNDTTTTRFASSLYSKSTSSKEAIDKQQQQQQQQQQQLLTTININNSSNSSNSSTAGSSFRGIFAKTSKDALGQALTVVIGTGALIFLLNLIIVLIIALRSTRTRADSRPQAQQENSSSNSDNCGQKSSASGQPRACPGVCDVNQLRAASNGRNNDLQTITGGAIASVELTKLELTSSFKGHKQQRQQQQQQYEKKALGRQCVGGGGGGQKAIKSIKFNLPELASDSNTVAVNNLKPERPVQSSSAISCPTSLNLIMPISGGGGGGGGGGGVTSDDETSGDTLQRAARCVIHGGHNDDQQQQQQQYQLMSSPPSYLLNELSDEIDLDDIQLSGDELNQAELFQQHQQQFVLLDSSCNQHQATDSSLTSGGGGGGGGGSCNGNANEIYLTQQHQQQQRQLADLSANLVNSCQHYGATSGSNNYPLQQQQQHLNRSLGSSSLTSPYASQSTATNNVSASTNVSAGIYRIRPAVMKQVEMRPDTANCANTLLLNEIDQSTAATAAAGFYSMASTTGQQHQHQFGIYSTSSSSATQSTSATPVQANNHANKHELSHVQHHQLMNTGARSNYRTTNCNKHQHGSNSTSNNYIDDTLLSSQAGGTNFMRQIDGNYSLIYAPNQTIDQLAQLEASDCEQQLLSASSFVDPNNVHLLIVPSQRQLNNAPPH